jgi:hypothetical protein
LPVVLAQVISMAAMAKYRYAMKWQRSGDKEYLLRRTHVRGMGKSLGVRSARTEEIYAANQAARAAARTNLQGLPNVAGELIGALVVAGLADAFRVVGTHAIHGYEALAGVHCKQELLASGDVDLLYDARKRLTLVAARLDGRGLLGLLQRVDKSFARQAQALFRAVNANGFMVDMLTPERDMRAAKPAPPAEGDLVATETPNLHWLLHSPRIEAVAIQDAAYAFFPGQLVWRMLSIAASVCCLSSAQRIASHSTMRLHTDTMRMSQPNGITFLPPPMLPRYDRTQSPPNHGSSHPMCRQPNAEAGRRATTWWWTA